MKLSLVYMDAGSELFAGFGIFEPLLLWNPSEMLWMEIAPRVMSEGWAQRVSPSEALRCYPGSVDVALALAIFPLKSFDRLAHPLPNTHTLRAALLKRVVRTHGGLKGRNATNIFRSVIGRSL